MAHREHTSAVPTQKPPSLQGCLNKTNTTLTEARLCDKALTRGFSIFVLSAEPAKLPAAHPDLLESVPSKRLELNFRLWVGGGGAAILQEQGSTLPSREGHRALDRTVAIYSRMGSGSQGRSRTKKSSINTFNWIRLYSAFSLQDAALASQGQRQDHLEPRGSTSSGLGVMATLPQASECPRPEALWRQRLQAGRRAVTHRGSRNLSLESAGVPTCRPQLSATRDPTGRCFSTSHLVHPGAAAKRVPCAQGQDQAQGHEAPEQAGHPCPSLSLSSGQSREPLSSYKVITSFFPFFFLLLTIRHP